MRKVFLITIWLIGSCLAWAQSVPTCGTEFWYTFPESRYCSPSQEQINFYILAPRQSNVIIANLSSGWDTTVSIPAAGVVTVSLPREECFCSGDTSREALYVTASDTVSLYASYACNTKIMLTPVWPAAVLSTHYLGQNYQAHFSQKYPAQFVVVAVEDSTVVNIWPHHHNLTSDGDTQVVLAAGMCRSYKTYDSDISDIRFTSPTCQPFALFQSNAALNIADNDENCNYVANQAVAVDYWGRQYVAVPSGMGSPDKVRVMSLKDRCTVWRNGQVDTILDASQWYEYSLEANDEAQYIESSSPIGVTFLQGAALSNGVGNGNYQMFPLLPLGDAMHQVTAYCPPFPNVSQHYLTVIAQTAHLDSLLLDDSVVANLFAPVPQRPDYAYARIPVAAGQHHLRNTQGEGFLAAVSGTGESSYGCLVGAIMRPMTRAHMFFDSVEVSPFHETTLCVGDTAHFSMQSGMYDSIARWYFGDNTVAEGPSAQHSYVAAGDYQVMLVITYHEGLCRLSDTLFASISVLPSSVAYFSDTITSEQLPWTFSGRTYNEEVINDTLRYTSMLHCDSLVIYSLYVIDDTIHEDCNDTLLFPNVVTANGDGINDRFVIVGLLENNCYQENSLYIYNRWGREMYHVRNICRYEDFWNPNVLQRPDGTYFFVFKARSATKEVVHHGVIEVIR